MINNQKAIFAISPVHPLFKEYSLNGAWIEPTKAINNLVLAIIKKLQFSQTNWTFTAQQVLALISVCQPLLY